MKRRPLEFLIYNLKDLGEKAGQARESGREAGHGRESGRSEKAGQVRYC